MLYTFARIVTRLTGWKMQGEIPKVKKFVMIAAPHTTNWDVFFMLILVFYCRIRIRFLMKHTIFKPPFGGFFRWLGGIPLDRTSRHNTVDQCIALFEQEEELILTLSPEGTRKKMDYWKSGFYYVALGANVPILLGYLDYTRKVGGVGPLIYPTGDVEADLGRIREFYATIEGKNPELFSPVVFKQMGDENLTK